MRRLPVLLLACVTLLMAACAQDTRNDALVATLNAYANAVRWNGLQSALQYIDPKLLKAHPPSDLDLARYRQVRVSDYDDGSGPVPVGDNEVKQTVRISFINIHTQVERSIVVSQHWRYDEQAKRWWLEDGPPDIRQD